MENKEYYDQLIVRVGKGCNFKCNFCNVSSNEGNVKDKELFTDIIRNFLYKYKFSNFTGNSIVVTISGGEPSIFKTETLFSLKYISDFLKKRNKKVFFDIQTNGSNIDSKFAKNIYNNGVSTALISYHTIDKDIFEKTIGVNYNFLNKINNGIENLNKAGIIINTNSIISLENKDYFFATLKYLYNKFSYIDEFNIGVIQPHGEAQVKINEIAPLYKDISYIYNKTLFYLYSKGKKVLSHYVGLPLCYLDLHKVSLELKNNLNIRKQTNKNLINLINDNNKKHFKECGKCIYNNVCSGIWNEYEGMQTLNPKQYYLYGKSIDNKYLYKNYYNLIKNYNSNIRQVIILYSLYFKELSNIVKESIKIGYYKVSLVIDSEINDIDIKTILISKVSNIQINIKYLDIHFLKLLCRYNDSVGIQFKINIDILVTEYSEKNLMKIKDCMILMPNLYLNIYFSNNYFLLNNITKFLPLLDKIYNRFGKNNGFHSINFYKPLLYKERY